MVLITTTYGFADGSFSIFYSGYANRAQAERCLLKIGKDIGVTKIVWDKLLPASGKGKNHTLTSIMYHCQEGTRE